MPGTAPRGRRQQRPVAAVSGTARWHRSPRIPGFGARERRKGYGEDGDDGREDGRRAPWIVVELWPWRFFPRCARPAQATGRVRERRPNTPDGRSSTPLEVEPGSPRRVSPGHHAFDLERLSEAPADLGLARALGAGPPCPLPDERTSTSVPRGGRPGPPLARTRPDAGPAGRGNTRYPGSRSKGPSIWSSASRVTSPSANIALAVQSAFRRADSIAVARPIRHRWPSTRAARATERWSRCRNPRRAPAPAASRRPPRRPPAA